LQSLFQTIHIPFEVEKELAAKGPDEDVPDVLSMMQGWVVVQSPISMRAFPNLHPGEAAAISLALEHEARLLMDEKSGRKVAIAQGIPVIGTVGILIEAAEKGYLDLAETFGRLKVTNFRFPEQALDLILEQFHQRHPK
jgi:uncharacterized protein